MCLEKERTHMLHCSQGWQSTGQYVNTGFNRSLLVDWWSIGRLKKTWSL